jgi:hypothetical protein
VPLMFYTFLASLGLLGWAARERVRRERFEVSLRLKAALFR